ncbi:MAG TPA: LLM class flavin-dependent oxidoreductase [Streptosporangiaceae bacterium]
MSWHDCARAVASILAKIVTTLDVISRGRAIPGIGGAWYDVEHQGLGIDYPGAGVRLDMLEEAVQVCRAMFAGDGVSFCGTHYRLDHARNLPRPVQAGGPKIGPGARDAGGGRLAPRRPPDSPSVSPTSFSAWSQVTSRPALTK